MEMNRAREKFYCYPNPSAPFNFIPTVTLSGSMLTKNMPNGFTCLKN